MIDSINIRGLDFKLSNIEDCNSIKSHVQTKSDPFSVAVRDLLRVYETVNSLTNYYEELNKLNNDLYRINDNDLLLGKIHEFGNVLSKDFVMLDNIYKNINESIRDVLKYKSVVAPNYDQTELLFSNIERFTSHQIRIRNMTPYLLQLLHSPNINNPNVAKNMEFFMKSFSTELDFFKNDYEPMTTQLSRCIKNLVPKIT
ncbi:Uncharacterised protein [Candidatus Tiddalikarchaeum anstoanum]|nr:Uncharacterised protein [Candidatus Tiddalikarchaeum anstoanum]